MKIILVGYMGSGKSTIGMALAEKLDVPFIDLDAYIEANEKKTITEIFAEEGQIVFRKKEHTYLKTLLEKPEDMVLATGGGAPCYAGNMDAILKASPNVFYLKLSIGELVKRLSVEKEKRPLIAHLSDEEMPEFFGKHLFERNEFYAKAKHTILSDSKSVGVVVDEITAHLV